MAMDKPTPALSAQVVGNAFVEQYYHVLHLNPEMACRFYQENSVLSRPNLDGCMMSATTVKSINDLICSLDYKNCKAEIKTADAQYSFHDGVVLLVTGSLTGNDHQQRKFTQTFFLAPQDTGYFVLNDVFRYVDDSKAEAASGLDIGIDSRKPITLTPEPEPSHTVDPPQSDLPRAVIEDIEVSGKKDDGEIVDEKTSSVEKELVVEPEPHINVNHALIDSEAVKPASEENTPKKSYASIVSSQTKKGPTKVYVPASAPRVVPTKVENQPAIQAAEVSTSEASFHPTAAPSSESNEIVSEDEGHSIYIRNLPLSATVTQLEAEFSKFGPIKPDGIQVRNNRVQGFCFGFVEFREFSSMQNAIKASPITIGDRQAVVELKRATSRVGGGRNRFTPTRGTFRNDNFRGHGSFSGGRAYVRSDTSFREWGGNSGGRTGDTFYQGRGRGTTRPPAPDSNLVAN